MLCGVCQENRECFMVPIEQRDSKTLFTIIKDRILPGTTIISNCWKAYSCLEEDGYQRLTVNHSINFVDPNNRATNNIERLWMEVKKKVPSYDRRKKYFADYLARSMFIMTIIDPNKRFHIFLQETASLYNPYTVGPPPSRVIRYRPSRGK